MKATSKDIDVWGQLFDIPLGHCARHHGLIPLKYFKKVDVDPFVYDRFIEALGQFPPPWPGTLYFAWNVYVDFTLHMRSNYTNTKSKFYGSSKGHSYYHPRARRDLAHVPPPLRLVPPSSQSIILLTEVEEPSQLNVQTRDTIVESMWTTFETT